MSPGWLKALTVGACVFLGLLLTILAFLLMLLLASQVLANETLLEEIILRGMLGLMFLAGLLLMVGGPYLILKGAIPLQ